MPKRYHKVLTIAGSDSGGGAGIQADLKTFSALGCYGMTVITALTAQNTEGVMDIHVPPAPFVRAQLEAVFGDMGADAVKIGMVSSGELVEIIAEQLTRYGIKNIVFDPVVSAQSGDTLTESGALETMKAKLLPLVTLLTPNLPEAGLLLNRKIGNTDEVRRAAQDLAVFGGGSVLIKGGHLWGNESDDVLFVGPEKRFVTLQGKRVNTRNDHGTGCTLSAALASFLAKGFTLEEAARSAKQYLQDAMKAGAEYEIGRGRGPVHHFFKYW